MTRKKRVLLGSILLVGIWLFLRNFYGFVPYQEGDDKVSLQASSLPYYDYKGVIHAHSIYSDGAGDFPEIISEAQAAQIDYLITSDHNTLKPYQKGLEGWHQGLILLIGEEISTDTGHLLALRITKEGVSSPSQKSIDSVNKDGGFSFLAHSENMKIPWRDWNVQGYTGIEIINMDSVVRRKALQIDGIYSLLRYLQSPNNLRDVVSNNPPTLELKRWDELTKERRVVGISSVDAHGIIKIFDKKYKMPTYEHMFRSATTHVVTGEKFSGDFSKDKELLYKTIELGHVYGVFEETIPATGFLFFGENSKEKVVMGDEIVYQAGEPLKLFVSLPNGQEGIIKLVKDGKIIKEHAGRDMTYTADGPGVYRVEVYLYDKRLPFNLYWGSRPWIYSNPIYIR